jgi:adenylosuccinate synthase
MSQYAVIGLGFGDEGKGITTDYLARLNPSALVVRYSGGQQAGHTVVTDIGRHVFANFGSGTLRGNPTYISSQCTIDPVGIMRELAALKGMGITPRLMIDANTPVTTPYDKLDNREKDFLNGTTGAGVGSTKKRETAYYSLLAGDLLYPSVVKEKLSLICIYYGWRQDWHENEIKEFNDAVSALRLYLNSGEIISIENSLPYSSQYIYEGSQGLMLDPAIGFFPHVTSSRTGMAGIMPIAWMGYINEVYYVTRAYLTRHGNGPMPNEYIPHTIKIDPAETNQNHVYQGDFRRAYLDLDIMQYAMGKDRSLGVTNTLVMTCLDHMNEYVLTHRGLILKFPNEDKFVEYVASTLSINKVILSRSNNSINFEEIKL